MPKGNKLTAEQRESIPQLYKEGKSTEEIATALGVVSSTIYYHATKAGVAFKTGSVPTGVVRNGTQSIGVQVKKLIARGWNATQIATKLNVTRDAVYYWQKKVADNDEPSPRNKQEELAARIRELRKEGLTIRAIAKKLHRPEGTISYRLYAAANGRSHHKLQQEESSNGHNPINNNIRIGIAYAETERFIGVLGQRLSLAPELLRSRLSELLGHSPMRSGNRLTD